AEADTFSWTFSASRTVAASRRCSRISRPTDSSRSSIRTSGCRSTSGSVSCPFDAIKMDHNFELSNYERHQTHIFSLQDLLVSSEFYAKTHPQAWNSADEVAERTKVAKKKDQRLQKALAGSKAAPAAATKPAPQPAKA